MVGSFRNLESHRRPVLRLFRQLIRLASDLEGETGKTGVAAISYQFKKYKGLLEPYKAREVIMKAFEWEQILRSNEPCRDKRVNQEIERYKEEMRVIQAKKERRKSIQLNSTHVRQKENAEIDSNLTDLYNPPPNEFEKDKVRQTNRLIKYRGRAIKEYQSKLSRKAEIDDEYVDLFLAPQYQLEKRKRIVENICRRELERPKQARLSYVNSPVGPLSYLKLTGKSPTPAAGAIIREAMQLRFVERVRELEGHLELAIHEAHWENQVAGASEQEESSLDDLINDWTEPIREAIAQIQDKRKHRIRKMVANRKVLVMRRGYIQRVFDNQQKNRIKMWIEELKQIASAQERLSAIKPAKKLPYRRPL
ncbi:hypothetical protein TRVA0_023S01486 [Trichomonascus vanleenenianus]|uniref:uncharacterized protein n=1 Tax=Trichomonascus vanleenenianus TaxID=2268995 RepID=UPI003ECB1042